MIGAARWLLGIAIAAQIGRDHGKLLRQPRREFVPGQMSERIAVHQQKRWARAAMHRDNARAAGIDFGAGKVFEDCVFLPGVTPLVIASKAKQSSNKVWIASSPCQRSSQ